MKLSAETNYFEIKYEKDGYTYTTTISAGIIDDKDIVIKYLKRVHGIELIYIRKLNY